MARIFGEAPSQPAKRDTPSPVLQGGENGSKGMLVYIHVPFCRSKCQYCAFHSQSLNQVTLAWYVKLLTQEIELWGARLKHPRVETVYFGGGTPSLMGLDQFRRIMGALREHFAFTDNMEITTEANPDSGQDLSWYRTLLSLGVNRLSLGVQSLSDEHLQGLGRPHSAQMAVEAYGLARQAGFANISLDLIWGLPNQRLKHWIDQLKTITRLGPEHLSCYGLTLEEGTPLYHRSREEDLGLPPEQEAGKMFVYGAQLLESEGYLQYEISNFARMGYRSRHNMGYWQGRDYLGLGPSAVSTLGRRRFTNPRFMDEYDAAVRGEFAGEDFEELDDDIRLKELVMLSLRTADGLDLKEHRKLAGFDLVKAQERLVQGLYQNGLIRINRGRLRLTKEGMAVSNAIIERLALADPPATLPKQARK